MKNKFFLMDLERTINRGITHYWKSARRGYTTKILEAGLYSAEMASEIVKEDPDKRTVMIPFEMVENITGITASTYETAQVGAIWGDRLNLKDVEFVQGGPEATQSAKEYFEANKEMFTKILGEDTPDDDFLKGIDDIINKYDTALKNLADR